MLHDIKLTFLFLCLQINLLPLGIFPYFKETRQFKHCELNVAEEMSATKIRMKETPQLRICGEIDRQLELVNWAPGIFQHCKLERRMARFAFCKKPKKHSFYLSNNRILAWFFTCNRAFKRLPFPTDIWAFVDEAGLFSGFQVIIRSGPFGFGGRTVIQADTRNSGWLFRSINGSLLRPWDV